MQPNVCLHRHGDDKDECANNASDIVDQAPMAAYPGTMKKVMNVELMKKTYWWRPICGATEERDKLIEPVLLWNLNKMLMILMPMPKDMAMDKI